MVVSLVKEVMSWRTVPFARAQSVPFHPHSRRTSKAPVAMDVDSEDTQVGA